MDEQRRGLSVARLMDREKYYKDKALKLEKDFIFANEKITILEEKLDELSVTHQKREKDYLDTLAQYNQLKSLYDDLKDQYDKEARANQQLVNNLQEELKILEKRVRTDEDINHINNNEKVKSYERLLAEVQTEINEKDRELAHYKRRISILEKRLKLGAGSPLEEKPDLDELSMKKADHQAIAFFDYAIVYREDRCIIRGNLVIENTGLKTLDTPYICFRFSPGDAAEIKGRIKTWENVDSDPTPDHWEWVFLDNDWAREAKDRGEIWVYPTASIAVQPGERVILNDWQIPIQRKYFEHLTIEVFVYFEKNNYRIKGANQIVLNF
ncbi:MAG: hypothetical protein ACO1OT_18940 [Heyndrickxia sp.]